MSGRAPAAVKRRTSRRGSSSRGRFLRRENHAETLNDALFIGLLLGLAWVPFRFGSNHLIAWGINAALFGFLLVVFELALLFMAGRHPVAPTRLWPPILLFIFLVGWIVLQIVPWTPEYLHNDFWQLTRDIITAVPGVGSVDGSISVTPDQGVIGLVRLLTCAAAFWLALQLCRDGTRAGIFLLAFVAISAAYALYGIVQLMFFPTTLLWIEKPAYLKFATSTFINRNSYATYAGMGLLAGIGLLIDVYRNAGASRSLPFSQVVAALVDVTSRRALPLIVAIISIAIALLWTASRAGIISSLAGVLALFVFSMLLLRRQLMMAVIVAGIFVVMVSAMLSYGGGFAERLTGEGGADVRFAVVQRAVDFH